jgi:hypothetical protein
LYTGLFEAQGQGQKALQPSKNDQGTPPAVEFHPGSIIMKTVKYPSHAVRSSHGGQNREGC